MTSTPRLDVLIATSRVVAYRPAVVDVAGDVVAGILLSQILYWMPRATVNREGKTWVAKAAAEWWEECRLTEDQVRRAMKTLRDLGLVETRVWKWGGAPTTHVHLVEARLESALAALDPTRDNPEWIRDGAQMETGDIPNGSGPGPESIEQRLRTETTTETFSVDEVDDPRQRPEYGFDHFWADYPRRTSSAGRLRRAGSKADALKVWGRLDLDTKKAAYRGAQTYAAETEAAFVMDAVRFLRGRHWETWIEDAPEAPRSPEEAKRTAAEAWDALSPQIGRLGRYGKDRLEVPGPTLDAVDAVGWSRLCQASESEGRRLFLAAYVAGPREIEYPDPGSTPPISWGDEGRDPDREGREDRGRRPTGERVEVGPVPGS